MYGINTSKLRRISFVFAAGSEDAKPLLRRGRIMVLAAFVSPYYRDRDFVRSKIGVERFIEIYIDTPLTVCEQRDPKGLYQRARRGEIGDFTGIHSHYEEPLNPDIRVSWKCGIEKQRVLRFYNYLNSAKF